MSSDWRRALLCCCGVLLVPALAGAQPPAVLEAADWARPRSAEMVLALAPVSDAVRTWTQTPSAELVIRHPRGEAGVLWADELRDWLVALGVPSRSIVPTPTGGVTGSIELSVRRTTAGDP